MNKSKKEKDDINSLCKRYFVPELCDESAGESDRSLFIELYEQLIQYGRKVSINYSAINSCDIEDIIQDAISECVIKWRQEPTENYKAYYSIAIRHAFDNANIKSGKIKKNEISLDNVSTNESYEHAIVDENQNKKHPELEPIIQRLDTLDSFYKKWCAGDLKGVNKKKQTTIDYLSARLTLEMREDFLHWGEIIKNEYNRTYSFLNKQILNMSNNLDREDIAVLFGLSESRGTHIYSSFKEDFKMYYD